MAGAQGAPAARPAPAYRRVIGRIEGRGVGPTLLCIGGVHGNEPAGVRALERVFGALSGRGPKLRGEFVGLAGNLAALAEGRRFLDRDLNRQWLPDRIAALRSDPAARYRCCEDHEQIELLDEMDAVARRARGDVFVVDLHTTSGDGPPFATIGDTLRNRGFGRRLPIPVILGLEEQLEGTLLEYVSNLGHVTLGVEGGQNESRAAVDYLEAAVWIALVAAGLIGRRELPEHEPARRRLRKATRGIPPVLEVRYRHPVTGQDGFRMNPGYLNFQPLMRGEPLAWCRSGEVRAPDGGRILMPLYQEQGDDGFFLVREVAPVWLTISAILRRLRFDRIAPWLLGVRRHTDLADTVVIDRRVARWYAVEVFHLLGFRREVTTEDGLVMSRRRSDRPPKLVRSWTRPPGQR